MDDAMARVDSSGFCRRSAISLRRSAIVLDPASHIFGIHRRHSTPHDDSPRQLPVPDPMGLGGVAPEPLALVLFVFAVVSVEPEDARVALEGEDVRGQEIEEPAVVRDDHRASGESLHRLLEGVDVEVVRRLVAYVARFDFSGQDQQKKVGIFQGRTSSCPTEL